MSRLVKRGPALLILLAQWSAGCDPGGPPPGAEERADAAGPVERWDSAGVAIVENRTPAWAAGEAWQIEREPALQIGVREGEAPYEFGSVADAAAFPDGRIAVADGSEIRVFDAEGNHLTALGGEGPGPGEFEGGMLPGDGAPLIRAAPPDTLVAWDLRRRGLSRFALDEGVLSDRLLAAAVHQAILQPSPGSQRWEVGEDGRVLKRHVSVDRTDPQQPEYWVEPILFTDDGGVVRSEPIFQGTGFQLPRDGERGLELARAFFTQVRSDLGPAPYAVALTEAEAWEVRLLDAEGKLAAIWRADVPREPVTEERLREERDRFAEPRNLRPGAVEEAYRAIGVPDSVPAISDLRRDREDRLWVARRPPEGGPPAEHDVVSPEGRWLGTVEIPENLGRILEIGDDYLLVTWRDELDIEYLRKHRIVKPAHPESG